jgi:hypothetical protein
MLNACRCFYVVLFFLYFKKKKKIVVKFELNHSCGLHFIGLLKVLDTSCH